jgi:hypothetical protein
MMNNYEITKELRKASVDFLTTYANYEKCLENLKNEEKTQFTEEEVNEILNLLGSFRLRDVFHVVERFKVEVTQLKQEQSEPEGATTEQAG